MANYSKEFLSQSTNGKAINLTTGLSAIHTTLPSSTAIDEVWIYAINPSAVDCTINILYGGSDLVLDSVYNGVLEAYAGNTLLVAGLLLKGDGSTGSSISGVASALSGANVFGYVNRIS